MVSSRRLVRPEGPGLFPLLGVALVAAAVGVPRLAHAETDRPTAAGLGSSAAEGPLQVVLLERDLVVLEIPQASRRLVLSLAPGNYQVRRRTEAGTLVAEARVGPGQAVSIREESIVLIGTPALAARERPAEAPAVHLTSLPRGSWELQLAAGYETSAGSPTDRPFIGSGAALGLDDRLELALLPALRLSWRLGDPGTVEVLLHGGTAYPGLDHPDVAADLAPGLGGAVRLPLGPDSLSVVVGAGVAYPLALDEERLPGDGRDLQLRAAAGFVVPAFAGLTLAPGVAVLRDANVLLGGRPVLELGSTVELGRARRPLVQLALAEDLFLDGHAVLRLPPPSGPAAVRLGLGLTFVL